ncbi:regulator component [Streptomyces sp. NPDC057287]|uniref:regulator component n=1 Tax=Streptomyces sp. NPDC057287 TaxID=3346086 RepID=UPI00363AC75F
MPAIDERHLRASCEKQIDQLNLPHRFSTRGFRDSIATLRGKPIVVKPLNTLGTIDAPCGIRLETPEIDFLYYEEGTSVHHQRHILTHELCHVLLNHPGSLEVDSATAHTLGVNPTLVMRMSGRTSYSTDDEREAEMMATVVRQRMYRERECPARAPEKGRESWDALFTQSVRKGRSRTR